MDLKPIVPRFLAAITYADVGPHQRSSRDRTEEFATYDEAFRFARLGTHHGRIVRDAYIFNIDTGEGWYIRLNGELKK